MYHECPMQTSPHRHFDFTVRMRNPRPGYRSRSALEVLTVKHCAIQRSSNVHFWVCDRQWGWTYLTFITSVIRMINGMISYLILIYT